MIPNMKFSNIEYSRIDWDRIRNISVNEKRNLLSFIATLKYYENAFYTQPIFLSLDHLFEVFKDDDYERMSLMLLVKGGDPESICNVLYNFLSSSNICDIKYLEYAIFSSYFLRLLLFGESDILDEILISYLGLEFLKNWFNVGGYAICEKKQKDFLHF